jgi:hypothetical protein
MALNDTNKSQQRDNRTSICYCILLTSERLTPCRHEIRQARVVQPGRIIDAACPYLSQAAAPGVPQGLLDDVRVG